MKQQQIVTYPAIITPDENQTYDIEFVDVSEALSFGQTINEAVMHGQEALGLALYHQKQLPVATPIEKINIKESQMVVLVMVDLAIIRSQVRLPTVRKNVTVPADLAAEAQGLNFSATLTEALETKLEN